jgi:CelD/BcsL family acetyltransferase involved in cellulose biosynthesis
LILKIAHSKDSNKWNDFVEKDVNGNFFDTFEWCIGLNEASKKIKPLPFFMEEEGKTIGVFPLCLNHYLLRRRLESLPFSDYGGGPFFREGNNGYIKKLMKELLEFGTKNGYFGITIKRSFSNELIQQKMINKPLILEDKNCTFTISLKKGIEKIVQKISRSRLKRIRQSKKRRVCVREAENLDDLERYYKIYLHTMQRLRSSPLPFQFYKYLWDVFMPKGEMKIFLAEYNNQVIAGVLRFMYKKTIHAWGACSLKEYWNKRPIDRLFWHTIKWGIEKNYKIMDLGSTINDPSSGHYYYKNSWGGELKPLYNYNVILQPKKWNLYKSCTRLVNLISKINH